MIEDFLDHRCDIYHFRQTQSSPGFGLPASCSFSYQDEPDISDLECHFGIKSQAVTIIQQQPQKEMTARIKLTLPAGTDIRINDKVVDRSTGFCYTSEVPHPIRNNHIFVYIHREGNQKPL